MTIVTSVPTHLVLEAWGRGAARWVDAAIHSDPVPRYGIDDVLKELLAERAALWMAYNQDNADDPIDAAMITVINDYPLVREYFIPWAGGRRLWTWVREFDRLTVEAAKMHGCAVMSCNGRVGWKRFGYRQTGAMLIKEVA